MTFPNSAGHVGVSWDSHEECFALTNASPELDDLFCAEADKAGMTGMKGHRACGGMRVSLYNAIELKDVKTLTEFLDAFARRRG